MPLGLLPGAAYEAHADELGPGDLLLVYTDGITEAADPDEEEFGSERLADLVRRHRSAPLAEVRGEIERALHGFVRGVPYGDDRTMLFLRRGEG